MQQNRWVQIVGALFLIGAGVIFMLQNLGLLPNLAPLFWGLLLLAGGLLFLGAYLSHRSQWWPLFPAAGMGGTGLLIVLDTLGVPGEWAASVLFFCLAGAFAVVYATDRQQNWWAVIPGGALLTLAISMFFSNVAGGVAVGVILFLGLGLIFVGVYFTRIDGQRQNWWALIPAGALLSLALVVLISTIPGAGGVAGAVLFLGLGVTFGVLYLMRSPTVTTHWAWIPSLALLAFGAFVLFASGAAAYGGIFWAVVLIAAGAFLIFRQLRGTR